MNHNRIGNAKQASVRDSNKNKAEAKDIYKCNYLEFLNLQHNFLII